MGSVLAGGLAHADPLGMPAMSGPLAANSDPFSVDAGPLGRLYVTGAVSGLGLWQSNPASGDNKSLADLTNGQVFIQKPDGPVQFFVQGGIYSIPSLGAAYVKSDNMHSLTYGVVPQGFIKFVPADNFSIQIGKLPTLIGSEYTFTFENLNIERGLLWNQEPAVSRGVQANYTGGPLSASFSWNDGYYSNRFNWVSGSLAYTISDSDSMSFIGGGNLGRTAKSTFTTPVLQNNGAIYNLIYTHASGPWVLNPYLQYANVPSDPTVGITKGASTFGVALLARYAFDDAWKLAGRVEYITASGSAAAGSPNLLYGPGSDAWSLTLTPTYQQGLFFARAEASYLGLSNSTTGFGFGRAADKNQQTRFLFETGILF